METKVQRLIQWIRRKLGCASISDVRKIPGTNIETFRYNGYQVEVAVYCDRVVGSIYLKGQLLIKFYRFANPPAEDIVHSTVDHVLTNYKVRNYVREYVSKRLKEITNNTE